MTEGIRKPFITVFTPTYNRAHTLDRVYNSLKSQTFRDFEWIIVDDGSSDNTKEIVQEWIDTNKDLNIRYFYQENGGKHIAINHGVSKAKGELFLIADSDDGFVPDTLKVFNDEWEQISDDSSFAGIWCLCQDIDGKIVGDEYPNDNWDAFYYDRIYKRKLQGEKWHIEKLSIMKEFPFPEVKVGHGFYFGESTIWNRIYKNYKARHINQPLRIYYDSSDGIMALIANNPHRDQTIKIGALEMLNNDINYFFYNPLLFLYTTYNYLRSNKKLGINLGTSLSEIGPFRSKILLIIVRILSFGLVIYKKLK